MKNVEGAIRSMTRWVWRRCIHPRRGQSSAAGYSPRGEVHDHPAEWFDSLDDYILTRTFRAAYGDVIVSETTASYTIRAEGRKCREFGVDVYWVNDEGLIYHKHTCEVVKITGTTLSIPPARRVKYTRARRRDGGPDCRPGGRGDRRGPRYRPGLRVAAG